MMYAVTLILTVAFMAWMMNKGLHWYDEVLAEEE